MLELKTNIYSGYYVFVGADLGVYSSHLLDGYTIDDWDYAQIPNYQQPASQAEKPVAYSPGWRDAYIQTLERMNDHAAYDAAIARLPLPPAQPQTAQQSLVHPNLRVSSIYQSTDYGYVPRSVNQINHEPERVKYQELLAAFSGSAAQNQQAGNQIVSDFGQALATNAAAQSANDAELLRAQVSIAGIVAVQNSPRKTAVRIDAKSEPVQDPALPPLGAAAKTAAPSQATPPEALTMVKVIKTSCVSCHSGVTPAKNFDILKRLGDADNEKFQEAAEKISGKVSRGEMPVDKQGVAHPLSAEQIKAVNLGLQSLGAQLNVVEAE